MSKTASIEVNFTMNGKDYRALRSMQITGKSTSSNCQLWEDGQLIAGPKVSDFEAAVATLLGPHDLFMASVFSSQGNSGDICSAKPSERKAVFGQLLGLGRYDLISAKAKEEARELEVVVSGQEALVKGLRERAGGLKAAQDELGRVIEARDNEEANTGAWRVKVAELEVQVRDEAVAQESWKREQDNLASEIRIARMKVDTAERALTVNESRVSILEGTPQQECCHVCPLVKDALKAQEQIPALQADLSEALKGLAEVKAAEARAVVQKRPQDSGVQHRLTKAKEAQRYGEKLLADLAGRIGALQERIDAAQSAGEEADQVESQLAHARQEISDLRAVEQAFGRSGIQPLLIETARPELEEIAAELLGKVTDGRMSVRFETQKELKSGDTVESLDIIITMDGMERKIEDLSGGEQKLIRTAVRLTLAIWQARKGGSRLKTIFIDEVADALDGENSARVLALLAGLTTQFERIFIVSHDDDLLEALPVRLNLKKGSGIEIIK